MLHQVPDNYLSEILLHAKKLASIVGQEPNSTSYAYNLLQNNGRLAHQVKTILDQIGWMAVKNKLFSFFNRQ